VRLPKIDLEDKRVARRELASSAYRVKSY
jgi:hypothetical protein